MPEFLDTGPTDATATLILAHGAGAAMDSRFMNELAALLAERSIRVLRFEFGYMASRRTSGKRRPAPKASSLQDEYKAAISAAEPQATGALFIGGKSMGGRVASLIASEVHAAGRVRGLVCIGYPFHPPKLPEKLRTEHLAALTCPTLIAQGERDPFGCRAEAVAYQLSKAIDLVWITDGDHDFGPRGASGVTRKQNQAAAADAVAAFIKRQL